MSIPRFKLVRVKKDIDIDVDKKVIKDNNVNKVKNEQIDLEREFESEYDETKQGNRQYNKQINYNFMKQHAYLKSDADSLSAQKQEAEAEAENEQKQEAKSYSDADSKSFAYAEADADAKNLAVTLEELNIALIKLNAFLSHIEIGED